MREGLQLRRVKAFALSVGTAKALVDTLNKITAGLAVTNVETGTDALAAGWVAGKTVLDVQYDNPTAAVFSALILYAE